VNILFENQIAVSGQRIRSKGIQLARSNHSPLAGESTSTNHASDAVGGGEG
jgi:hypothetical protein